MVRHRDAIGGFHLLRYCSDQPATSANLAIIRIRRFCPVEIRDTCAAFRAGLCFLSKMLDSGDRSSNRGCHLSRAREDDTAGLITLIGEPDA